VIYPATMLVNDYQENGKGSWGCWLWNWRMNIQQV